MFNRLFDHSLGYFSLTNLYGDGKMMISINAMSSILALSLADDFFFFFFDEMRSLMKMKRHSTNHYSTKIAKYWMFDPQSSSQNMSGREEILSNHTPTSDPVFTIRVILSLKSTLKNEAE